MSQQAREQPELGVDLPTGSSASAIFHEILASAVRRFPSAFESAAFPDGASAFRGAYPEVLGRFEAARASRPERADIARALALESHSKLVLRGPEGEVPLAEAMGGSADPLAVETLPMSGSGRFQPRVPEADAVFRGDGLVAFARALVARHAASSQVAEAIDWLLDHALDEAGEIDLSGRRIAVLGAGAELAPTLHWLEAGADVLWIDVAPPPEHLTKDSSLSGRLHHVPGGADLLARPREIRATLERFAEAGAIDLGLYGYAAGRAREWRLAAAMNAIVDALPSETVRTVTLLISPTSPAVRTPAEDDGEQARLEERKGWQAALAGVGLLGKGTGSAGCGGLSTSRSIVSIQGVSYQAAQYLEKWIAAEVWATREDPLLISANVAGVTRTRSLRHPVFAAAFSGAGAFGVETYAPETTRALMALLAARDWLDPESVDIPSSVRVHGGLYVLPTPLEPSLRVAAVIGLVKDPKLVGGLFKLLRR